MTFPFSVVGDILISMQFKLPTPKPEPPKEGEQKK